VKLQAGNSEQFLEPVLLTRNPETVAEQSQHRRTFSSYRIPVVADEPDDLLIAH
jgi:hypothetical protein